jgi:formylglycine-generating enzyme required for sulfatase activity
MSNAPAGHAARTGIPGDLTLSEPLNDAVSDDRVQRRSAQHDRAATDLRRRVRAGAANFEFGALLEGVANARAARSAINQVDGADLVWVPPGTFTMGSDRGERREQPAHVVAMQGFWIYKYPVTVAQYRRYYEALGRTLRAEPPWGWHDDHPVVNVTWLYAAGYADWAGAVLPTEAQWEYAARGADGRAYPWGDEWRPERCVNSAERPRTSVGAVGTALDGLSAHGAADMAGNVWEWTADWYDECYYARSPECDPPGPSAGTHRVVRGGSWGNCLPEDFRASTRAMCDPAARGCSIGFRCAIRADSRNVVEDAQFGAINRPVGSVK